MKSGIRNQVFGLTMSALLVLIASSQASAQRKLKGAFHTPSAISIELPGKRTVELKSGEATLSITESLSVVGKDVKLTTPSGTIEIGVPAERFNENELEFSYGSPTSDPKVTLHAMAERNDLGEREEVRGKRCTFEGVCYSCMIMPDFKMKCGEKKSKACLGNQDTRFKVTTTETIYKVFVTGSDARVRGEFTSEPDITENAEVLEILEPCR